MSASPEPTRDREDEPRPEAAAAASPARRKPRFSPRRVAKSVLSIYVMLCLGLFLVQSWIIYVPDRDYAATPRDAGMAYEDVRLTTADGVAIAAWYVSREDAKGTVILCHGNAGNMADRLIFMRQFSRFGYNVLAFDYRGFGESDGRPGEEGTYLDAAAAWAHVVEERGESPARIVIWGESLGGAVAIDLARRHTPGLLIVECTFTSMADVAADLLWMLPARLIVRHRYDSESKVPHIDCPKIFLHGRGDELIPFELGERLFAAASEPKVFVPTDGGHVDGGMLYNHVVTQRVETLMGQMLPGTASAP
jgi:fermentation-respiration switch protein FrsA (DUF1100 family)